MRIDTHRARDHLLEPGPRADVGQRCHHGHLRGVQPLVGHRHRDQDRGLGREAKGAQGLVRVALVRGGEAHLAFSLSRGYPALQPLEVKTRGLLVGGDHKQFAETARALARRQVPLGPAPCAEFAGSLERLLE
jgi:hypothetical protein